jgi:hypothetical protein
MSEMRDRRLTLPNTDTPFDHKHHGTWITMELVASAEVRRDGWVRCELTYACPSCGYELTESTPTYAGELSLASSARLR